MHSRTSFFLVRETCSELVTALFCPSFSCEFLGRRTWVVCHGLKRQHKKISHIFSFQLSLHNKLTYRLHSLEGKGKKVKVKGTWYSASLWANPITVALKYGTCFQGTTQFYLPPTRLSTNEINHACLCLPSRFWSSFTDPERMEGWVGLGTRPRTTTWRKSVFSCSGRHASPGN